MLDGNVILGLGEFYVVLKGVEYCLKVEVEIYFIIIELLGILNMGDLEMVVDKY